MINNVFIKVKILNYCLVLVILLSLVVIMLGAYTRLTNAGLGCPDWPGCYGYLILSNNYLMSALLKIKAGTEMLHRYFAGTLGLLIFLIIGQALYLRKYFKQNIIIITIILCLLVILQALLGMWTVTMQLLPIVVIGHLFGGMLILSGLCYLWMQINNFAWYNNRWHGVMAIAILLICFQIILGGLVSANYAGVACLGFPQCNGNWLPSLNWAAFYHVFGKIGINYQGGILDATSRVTLQYVHRVGAVIIFLYAIFLDIFLLKHIKIPIKRYLVYITMFLVVLQFILGIMNVIYLLPIQIAVAHTGIAALLLASFVMLIC